MANYLVHGLVLWETRAGVGGLGFSTAGQVAGVNFGIYQETQITLIIQVASIYRF